VTGVCSGRNGELVQSLGADTVIDYTAGDYRREAGCFDVIFDVTSYETPARCAGMLKDDGHFISTGGTARAIFTALLTSRKSASQILVESYTQDLQALNDLWDVGQLRSVIDSGFPLERAQQAYERSRSGRARGKIMIEIGQA
jgi:NADPH:quinone reductase-like Zn-dependent oxidoreductase